MESKNRQCWPHIFVSLALIHSVFIAGASAATATFENVKGTFLGFTPYTDPQSGIRFNNIQNYGLGASYFNNATLPSLYQNNTVLVEDSPQLNGAVEWSENFSVHGVLPVPANQMSVDILYFWGTPKLSAYTNGAVSLDGYGPTGQLVGTISTPTIGSNGDQISLIEPFASPITSFDIVSAGLSTDYDNIQFTPVPEPSGLMILAGLMGLLFMRRRRVPNLI